MAYSVSYTFEGGQTVGSVIGAEHFGTNYLFHHDRVEADSTFPEIVDRVGVDLIRYPGGTITEEYFDLANPTATVQASSFGRNDKTVTPIQDFLGYAQETGRDAVIVLPTYRYFDEVTRQIDPAAEAVIKSFVRAVMSGDYGEANIRGFEIGNEWYQTRFDWSAAEFGELQSVIGVWIDEVLQEDPAWLETGIYVQAGRGDDDGNGIEDDQELAAQFTEAEMDAIDGLISHFYASTGSGNPLILGGAVNRRLREMSEYWDTSDETGLDLVVTEWNIGGDGPDNTSVTGLMRSVALLNVFSNMMENGVDLSAIWTAQAPGPAALSNKEGDDQLTSTGYLYRMMRRELVDTQAVETVQDEGIYDANGTLIGRTYTFQGDGKTVIYIASGVGDSINLNVDFGSYMTPGSNIHATVLGVADGSAATDYRPIAQMTAISDGEIGNSGRYTFNLGDYEAVQVVITNDTGVKLFGDDQIATDDVLDGTVYADELYGFDGQDVLKGFDGNDLLDGGAGDDEILGGGGDDYIVAGAGTDTVDGGEGGDTLDYSDSTSGVRIYTRDGIVEEDGSNTVDSFSGIEEFIGSDFADTIFTDDQTASVSSGGGDDFVRILGGEDVSVDTGDGSDFVLAELGSADVQLGAGDDRLLSYSAELAVDGGAGDDVIHGGNGADTIDGGRGNDTLSGGAGEDVYVYTGQEGTDVILDFDTSADMLDFRALNLSYDDIDVIDGSNGAEIQIGGQSIVELQAVAAADVTNDLFHL